MNISSPTLYSTAQGQHYNNLITMALVAKSKGHPSVLFGGGKADVTTCAAWLEKEASTSPRCVGDKGKELSCSCLKQLTKTSEHKNAAATFIAQFIGFSDNDQKLKLMEVIKASQQEFPETSTAPQRTKHLRYRLPKENGNSASTSPSTKSCLVCQNAILRVLERVVTGGNYAQHTS
jgi:hypothetical protein